MILITGINGEMGNALIKKFYDLGVEDIVGLDIKPANKNIKSFLYKNYVGDIKDKILINKIFKENKISEIYHLAAILSAKSELKPFLSHQINVDGFLNLINQIKLTQNDIKFFFPSSIAVYSISDKNIPPITEREFCNPNNIYGCTKLYCEKLGIYFSQYSELINNLDFRSIRFSGIISADTLPTGGTSDYGPEMIHHAAQNKNYTCFVKANSCIPFMVMPDAINGILKLMETNKKDLTQDIYHIQSFSPTVQDMYKLITKNFPKFRLNYEINEKRQALIDSWPAKLDQTAAKQDWGWTPDYDFIDAFNQYLIPEIEKKYKV